MSTEKAIQEGIQTVIRGMAEFSTDSVVINDWTILDQSITNAPYCTIEHSDVFTSRQDAYPDDTVWSIPVTLIVAFKDWQISLNEFRDLRQSLLNIFNDPDTNARSAGGIDAVSIDEIRSESPIGYRYEVYGDEKLRAEQLPTYIQQVLIFEVREF